jgi:hypothetical protein
VRSAGVNGAQNFLYEAFSGPSMPLDPSQVLKGGPKRRRTLHKMGARPGSALQLSELPGGNFSKVFAVFDPFWKFVDKILEFI